MSALIEFEQVCKYYQMGDTLVKAADHITMKIEKGEFVAIVGQSGSGKSTLMNVLGCLDIPTYGEYHLNGTDVTSLSDKQLAHIRNREIGFIFQGYNLIQELDALENVTLPLIYQGVSVWDREDIAMEALEKVGMAERAHHRPSEMSGGQQQRVAIARALALHPDILCFDEPTSALDPELTGEVLKVIRSLAEQKTTMIIVTHEMAFARDVADQVIFMDGGVIVEQGPAHQVIEHPSQERTRQFLSRYAES